MSTKIYNAYVMERNTPKSSKTPWITLKDINRNFKLIAKKAMPLIQKEARGLLARELSSMYDDAVMNRLKLGPYELNSSVYSLACRKLDRAQFKAMNGDLATTLDFSLSAVIFTNNDGTPVAVIFFGHSIWLNYIYENCQKLGLRDYHYQNSTDKPDGVSTRDWDARKRFWAKTIPSGTPWQDGYHREIFRPAYTFFSDIPYSGKDWQKDRPSFESRVADQAAGRASYLYVHETRPNGDHTRQMFSAKTIALSGVIPENDKHIYDRHLKTCRERFTRVFADHKTVSFKALQQPVGNILPPPDGPKDPEGWVGAMVKVTLVEGEAPIHGYVREYEDSSRGKFLLVRSDRWGGDRAFVPGCDQLEWSCL